MKQILLLVLSLPLLLTSCRERGAVINFGTTVAKDTSYMATVQTPQPHNVLLEEYTGMRCVNCIDGHELVASLEAQYPGRIVPVALHMFNNGLTNNYPDISPVDFRTNEATQIDHDIYNGQTQLPFAGIDCTPYNGAVDIGRQYWGIAISNRLAITPPTNLSISSTYDAGSRMAIVKVSVHYTRPVSNKHALSIMLTENDLDAPQDYTNATTGISETHTSYIHNHILHKMYTPALGASILDSISTKPAGLVYERTFVIDISTTTWKPENCKIIAFVHNNEPSDKEVLQSAEVKLKQ